MQRAGRTGWKTQMHFGKESVLMYNKKTFNRLCNSNKKIKASIDSALDRVRGKRGVTLIEVIVVVAVMSILMAPLVGTFMAGYKGFYREDENVKVTRCARTAMERAVTAIRKAEVPKDDDGKYIKDDSGKYIYNIEQVSNEEIRVNGETIDADYAFKEIDGTEELEGKSIEFTVLKGTKGEIYKVDVVIKVEGIRTGWYEISTEVYMRNN